MGICTPLGSHLSVYPLFFLAEIRKYLNIKMRTRARALIAASTAQPNGCSRSRKEPRSAKASPFAPVGWQPQQLNASSPAAASSFCAFERGRKCQP